MSEEIDFFQMAESLPGKRVGTNFADASEKLPVEGEKVPGTIDKVPSPLDIEAARKALETPVMQELMSRAEHFTVSDQNDASEALTMQDQALTFAKQVEATRKEIVRPHLDFQKAVKQFADDLRGQFDAVRSVMQAKLEAFGQNQGVEETGIPLKLENDDATAYEETTWHHSVESADMIPREYLIVDERAIKAAIKDGVREIPGVNIYSETKTKYRSKPKKKEKKA